MSTLPPPGPITLPEECPVCCWCGKPISPVYSRITYPGGRVSHLRCPGAGPFQLCDHCSKPRMNCDCSDDSGFDRARFAATHPEGGKL